MGDITASSEALRVVLEHCHERVLRSRPRRPACEPGHGCSYEDGDGHDDVYVRAAQSLSQALRLDQGPVSCHRMYDFRTLTFATTRSCGRFVTWEPATSNMEVTKDKFYPLTSSSIERSRFCSAVKAHLARPAIAANLHSLHLANVPLHNEDATMLMLGLHRCKNIATLVVDGETSFNNAYCSHAPTFLPERPIYTLRTFVACYSKPSSWRESYVLRNARALTTLYLQKADLEGAWTTGAKHSDTLRVVHLHEVRADVSFWAALAHTPTRWRALRYHVGQHDQFLDGVICEQLASAFKPPIARSVFNMRLRMDTHEYGIVMQNTVYSQGDRHRLLTSHAISDVLRRLHIANEDADEHTPVGSIALPIPQTSACSDVC
ncbi:hypothetical protein CYMTET_35525 [Cymbomonas tetramitiformis]|uniref:Uncharacterized protein n=1 Tax=Cymbomonas tetramitiformis TaxID=36881 RepID=A0AAE0F936_9CHLO|nr:hypothetical protein CYMTET_35525 [Cymbomonas tetramitiformis]